MFEIFVNFKDNFNEESILIILGNNEYKNKEIFENWI